MSGMTNGKLRAGKFSKSVVLKPWPLTGNLTITWEFLEMHVPHTLSDLPNPNF